MLWAQQVTGKFTLCNLLRIYDGLIGPSYICWSGIKVTAADFSVVFQNLSYYHEIFCTPISFCALCECWTTVVWFDIKDMQGF